MICTAFPTPLIYLTAISLIVTLAIVLGVIAINVMSIRVKRIEELQSTEHKNNEELRNEIRNIIKFFKKVKHGIFKMA